MSDPKSAQVKAPARREQIRIRVEKLRQSRQRSALGLPEIVGFAAAAVMLLAVLFAYLYFLSPARSRLDKLQVERNQLQKQLQTSMEGVKRTTDTQAIITEINQSLQDFESNHLARRNQGRMALYDALNLLIQRNNLRNTAGPTYTALSALDANAPQGTSSTSVKTGNTRWQSVFPGIGVSVTIEGPYQNLRRFVRDIEASNQFIIINAVELESVTDTNATVLAVEAAPNAVPGPAGRATTVSLRLDMAAYFQRDASDASAPQVETR